MFVNDIPYFVTIIHHINFITALMTKYQYIKPVIETIKRVKAHYDERVFCIEEMCIDRQFELAHV